MLSIDFSDSQAKIVSGAFKNGTVTVTNSVTVDFEDGLINGGYVVDIPQVSSIIGTAMRSSQMKEKELVISFSSNQIVFKELLVPKVKGDQFNLAVNNQVKSETNISDDYNISFTIIGEEVTDDGKELVRVFATACPQAIVDSYINLASAIGCNLVGVNISSTCIARALQSEAQIKARCPLMIVQMDGAFLSMSIFNNNMIVFSRFVNIDKNEARLSDDYLARTAYDNVFRLMQFYNSQNEEEPIKEVLFYGKLENSEKVLEAVSKLGVEAGVLNQPTTVTGYAGFDFNAYANAVGAIYKRNKDTEHINLLESVSAQNGAQSKMFLMILGVLVLGSLLIIGLVFLYLKLDMNSKQKKIDNINAYIASKQEDINRVEALEQELNLLHNYKEIAKHLDEAYKTRPILDNDVLAVVDKYLAGKGSLVGISYVAPELTLTIESSTQSAPSNFAEETDLSKYFDDVKYNGYTTTNGVTTHTVILTVKGGEIDAE